jgi:hypothetical protein
MTEELIFSCLSPQIQVDNNTGRIPYVSQGAHGPTYGNTGLSVPVVSWKYLFWLAVNKPIRLLVYLNCGLAVTGRCKK